MSEIDTHFADLRRDEHNAWRACIEEIRKVAEVAIRNRFSDVNESLVEEAITLGTLATRRNIAKTLTPAHFRGYLRQAVANTYLKLIAQQNRAPVPLDSIPETSVDANTCVDDPPTMLEKQRTNEIFEEVRQRLTAEERTILDEICLEAKAQKTVAAEIGKGTSSMTSRRRQLLKKCRKIWKQVEQETGTYEPPQVRRGIFGVIIKRWKSGSAAS